MTIQALQVMRSRYVVIPKVADEKAEKRAVLKELAELRDKVSAAWKGEQDAVKEIRAQRGGDL